MVFDTAQAEEGGSHAASLMPCGDRIPGFPFSFHWYPEVMGLLITYCWVEVLAPNMVSIDITVGMIFLPLDNDENLDFPLYLLWHFPARDGGGGDALLFLGQDGTPGSLCGFPLTLWERRVQNYQPAGVKVLAPYMAFSSITLVRVLGAPQYNLMKVEV